MNRSLIKQCCILLIIVLFCGVSSGLAAVIDAPHNSSNAITCSSCHSYSLWWQNSPASPDSPSFGQMTTAICERCHNNNGSLPVMLTHSSDHLGSGHGVWNQNCIDCHDPHYQAQLNWISEYANSLFLVSGTLRTSGGSYVYTDNGDGTTTIAINSTDTVGKPYWLNPDRWGHKKDDPAIPRGLIFVQGREKAFNTYEVLSASADQITVRGRFEPGSTDPAVDNSFGLIYGQFIRDRIKTVSISDPNTSIERDVTFFDPRVLNSTGGFTDSLVPRQGICQVCHTQTVYWTEDGNLDGHNSGLVCTDCHYSTVGFKPVNDSHNPGDGIFAWDDSCVNCHNPDGNSTIIADIHKVGTSNSCTLCHLQESGGGLDPASSAVNATVGSKPHYCTECHINPAALHHAGAQAQSGDCGWCHPDPRTGWQSAFGVSGSMPKQLACRECHVQNSSNGLTIYKISYPLPANLTMTFPGGDLSAPAQNSPLPLRTALDGSNGTVNHYIASTSPIAIYNYGTCLSCHDGVKAAAVNVWHGRPDYAQLPEDSDNDAYHNHFDILRYAPGRSIFNLWRGDGEQGEPYFSHDSEYYDNGGEAEERGEKFYDAQYGRDGITWHWGQAQSFSLTTIPCFAANDPAGRCGNNSAASHDLVPVFTDGPERDRISLRLAAFDGAMLFVRAVNTSGELTLGFNGVIYPMTAEGNGAWMLNLPFSPLPVATLDIMTSNPLGDNLVNQDICTADPLQVDKSEWSPTDVNNGSLHLVVSEAAGTLVEAHYGGQDYPLSRNGAVWQLDLVDLPYNQTVDFTGQCGYIQGAPVANLSYVISNATAYWDGATLTVSADNTSSGAIVKVDYGSDTALVMTGGAANHWQLNYPTAVYHSSLRIYSDDFGEAIVPVVNTTPVLYPPDCSVANGADVIILPLAKAEFKASDTELKVKARNTLDDTGGTAIYMTYSETADGQSRYSLSREDKNEFEYKANGFTWQPGATVTVWSEDADGVVQAIACEQPVKNDSGGDQVSILTAEWRPDTRTLYVEAKNSKGHNARLYGEYLNNYAVPMLWDDTAKLWTLSMTDVDFDSSIIIHSDQDDTVNGYVRDMTPDTITIKTAIWTPDGSGTGSLFLRAMNYNGNKTQLLADYGAVHGIPLIWDKIERLWQVSVPQIGYENQVLLWSSSPGSETGAVTDMTGIHLSLTTTPQCGGCHTGGDIIFDIHKANCDSCHASLDAAVQDAMAVGGALSCESCHLAIDDTVNVQSVGFAIAGSSAIALKDHELPPDNNLITAPEYVDGGSNEPAAFVVNSPIVIEAIFSSDSQLTSARIGSSLFADKDVQFNNGLSEPVYFTLPTSVSAASGAYMLNIDWHICDKDGSGDPDCSVPDPLHETIHSLFITHGQPAGSAPFYSRLVQWASQWSTVAHDNDTIVQNIFDGIWGLGDKGYDYVFPFAGRTHDKVGDILRQGEGACGEWAIFMQRALESQGVDAYTTAIFPDTVNGLTYHDYRVGAEALGNNHGPWVFPDHTFVIYGGDINDFANPNIGTAYDPTYHWTGVGWGGYEDVIIDELGDEKSGDWQANPGFGLAPDVLNSKLLRVIDDWVYYYGMDDDGYDDASLYYYPRDGGL